MTDNSEPTSAAAAAPTPTPPNAPTQAAPVLAQGHLHPAILLLRLLDALRQAMFPALLGVVFEIYLLAVAAFLFLLQLGYALARYLTLEYTLTTEELRVREGLLQRQERRIPLDRIQDLGFESTLLRRALGLVVVRVETASGQGVEAQLDALSQPDAEHLREVLLQARAGHLLTVDQPAAAAPPPEPEWLVHRSSSGELLLRGLTDLRLTAFFVTGFAALQLADQLGFASRVRGVLHASIDWLLQFPLPVVLLLLVLLLLVVTAFGVITSTLGNMVQFHGFALTLRGAVLQRRYGLLTTRQKVLPQARIQRVTIEQPWLRRLVGVAVLKADSAGGSRAHGEDNAGGWDVVVPLCRLNTAMAMLPALLPGMEQEEFAWRRGSPRLVARMSVQGLLLAVLLLLLGWQNHGVYALVVLLLVPLYAVLGTLVYRHLGFATGKNFFALRHGIVGSYAAFVPTSKLQAVVVRQGPVAQLFGLADLTVYVAGGSPTRLPNLLLADARELSAELAARAVLAARRDWQLKQQGPAG